MSKKSTFLWMMSLIFLTVCMQTAWSDIYMKQKQHTDAMQIMGQSQPAQDMISEIWLTPNKMVAMSPKQKTVMDMGKKTITIVNHETKTYSVLSLDASESIAQDNKDESQQAMAEMMKNMVKSIKITVTATNERKKIGNWNCRKYNQTMEMGMMGTTKSEIWASPDIKIDKQMYAKFTAGMMAQMPGMSQNMDSIIKETEKIDGMQVYTSQSTEMMGQKVKSTTELLEYKEGKAPANVFDIPNSYKKSEMFQ